MSTLKKLQEMTDESLRRFASREGISYIKAAALRASMIARLEYNNKPEVIEKRKMYQKRQGELRSRLAKMA